MCVCERERERETERERERERERVCVCVWFYEVLFFWLHYFNHRGWGVYLFWICSRVIYLFVFVVVGVGFFFFFGGGEFSKMFFVSIVTCKFPFELPVTELSR